MQKFLCILLVSGKLTTSLMVIPPLIIGGITILDKWAQVSRL